MSSQTAEPRGGSRRAIPYPKVQIPQRASALVARPRLLGDVAPLPGRHAAAAEDEVGGRVTLICGPAGSGKTTLLVDWARHQRRDGRTAVAWVSLGADDNDVFVLWSSILTALELTGAFTSSSLLHRLGAPRHRLDPQFMATFVTAFRDSAPQPVHLVLDDLHEVHDPAALATLDVLLRNVPTQLHLLISARYAPPLALPRLRLEGRVHDIDRSLLGFTEAEADALLRLHGVELATSELSTLLSRTEGWAAGLRLAAMSLAYAADRAQLIAEFAGDNRAVADYLLGEVLERQEPDILDFLLATSICEQLTADLARLLSGREDAGALLDHLERTNSFISFLGDGCYRYHQMFRQYLCAELARRQHHRALQLHREASGWLEARGDTLAAIEHAAEARDDTLLTSQLVLHGLRHITNGEGSRIRRVLRRTAATSRRNPRVAAVAALAALDARDTTSARDLLQPWSAEGEAAGGDDVIVAAVQTMIRLRHAREVSDLAAAEAVLSAPSRMAAMPDLDMLSHLHRGEAWLWLGNLKCASDEFSCAQALGLGEHRPRLTMEATAGLAATALHAGDLEAADVAARDALWLAESHGAGQSESAVRARVTLGWVAYHRMEDQPAQTLAGVISGAGASGRPSLEQLGPRLLTAFARFSGVGQHRTVVQEVRDAWRLRRPGYVQPQLVAVTAVIEQSLAFAVGEGQWAVEVADRTGELLGETAELVVLRAAVHAHRGRLQAARQSLALVLRGEVPAVSVLTELEAWLWEARLALRMDDVRRAELAIAQAVRCAVPGQIMRPFHRGGAEVYELLARTAGTYGHHEPFVARVRSLIKPAHAPVEGLLTTRELELLAELPSLRTAEEIADSMYLSVNTVKTHIRGIYRKLGVNNRRDAVESARLRGML